MHYDLPGGRLVKSENAAKPASQPSRFLNSLFYNLTPVRRTLDYGCGKLRYLKPFLQTTEHLALVDSEVQLSRQQRLHGEYTSIRRIFAGSNCVSVYSVEEFISVSDRYERAFCVNVLSAIPFPCARREALRRIIEKLEPSASCLFVVQYRNSDFTRMASLPLAEPWEDGFVLRSLRGYSFYALISPKVLAEMLIQAGFELASQCLHEGSVYIWANRPT